MIPDWDVLTLLLVAALAAGWIDAGDRWWWRGSLGGRCRSILGHVSGGSRDASFPRSERNGHAASATDARWQSSNLSLTDSTS
jgi:hypothetical protein